MQKSRLIEVLKTFSKKDIRDCRKFIHSPIHNQRKDVVDLFEYLTPLIPFPKKAAIQKEKVFQKIFIGELYREKKISYTISFLYNCIKSYLAYQEFAQNKVGSQIYLSRAPSKSRPQPPFRERNQIGSGRAKSAKLSKHRLSFQ